MIGYITIGSSDVARSAEFYEALFAQLGIKRVYDYDKYVAWAKDAHSPIFSITTPFDGEPVTFGNGTMIALSTESTAQVDQLHALALSLGATDEGAPGMRSGGYYCAYFRDPDGNKLNFHCPPKQEA